jgi:hypothetical protein
MNAKAENEAMSAHKHHAVLMCAFENERGSNGSIKQEQYEPLIISFSPDITAQTAMRL